MVLKALEIQGFKSFPDKTKITFDHGITAVVGPNGSGKSNISDAIRWVLGETSSRQLRGSGKMEDVIFGGTQKRSGMGYAVVNLTVDNSDRRIDVDKDEVVIGRKYYRSGESEYSINGQHVRLKDIYELFLDTGLGRDGYSIIGQGRIAEIVAAKNNERREIFEEASGISKYRYRKNEAERRLAAAEDNLVRLRDIVGELEQRVAPLKAESEKAQTFLKLANQRKQLEVTLWTDSINTAKETLRSHQRKLDIAQADYEKQNDLLEDVDSQTEQIRLEIQRLTVEIERANQNIRQTTEEIAASESKVAVLENDIQHNCQTLYLAQNELQKGNQGTKQLQQDLQQCQQKADDTKKKKAELDHLAAQKVEQLEQLQQQSKQAWQEKQQINGQLAQIAQQQTKLAVEAAAAESALEAAEMRTKGLQSQQQDFVRQQQQVLQEKQENAVYLQQLTQKLQQLENVQGGLKLKLDKRRQQLDEADAQEQQCRSQQQAAQNRLHVLQELEKNMEGYSGSVKAVMRAAQTHRLRGIIGPVSSLFQVKPGYELAIETALGAAAQNIVVENEAAAKAAIGFLQQQKAGRATFLPLDTIRAQSMDTSRLIGTAVVAETLVQTEQRYQKILQNLLGRIVVVEDLNEASGVARSLDYRNRIVTVDGQVINAGGSYTGGSTSRSAGLFSRRQEIDELKKRLVTLEQQQQQAIEATNKIKKEVDVLSAEMNGAAGEQSTLTEDKIRAEMEEKRLDTALQQYEAASQLQQAETQQLVQKIKQNTTALEQIQQKANALTQQATQLEQKLKTLAGGDEEFIRRREKLSEELSAARMEALSTQKDWEAVQQQIIQLSQRSQESNQRNQQLQESIRQMEQKNLDCQQQIATILQKKEDGKQQIVRLEQKIQEATNQRMEKEGLITQQTQQVRGLTEQRENLSREISRLDEQKKAIETEYDQTVAKLWEEYEITPSEAIALCIPFDNVAELRRQVAEVRTRIRSLGNVNVAAIDEYAQVSERYEFLTKQVKDVENSKAQLHKMIAQLSEEMKQMFSESFAAINQNFARIFAELFGGGSAKLVLTQPEDVLTSGIEIQVSPPGKIIKNLAALSGGEQSLVAISIYFAIFAVNPAPFCILDEIEAALDDVNVTRYAQYLRRITDYTQFIVITHRRGTMEAADVLYGVTMQEDGVSKLLRLELDNAEAALIC